MALRLSTGLRNKILGQGRATIHALVALNTISFDNTSAEIRDSANGFVTAGFLKGDLIRVAGTASNNTTFTAVSVAAGVIVTTVAPTTEAAGTVFCLAAGTGTHLQDAMRNGVLRVYSGSQPTNADSAASGTLLAQFTVDGGTFVHGTATNGINWDNAASAVISKAAAETWKSTAVATGTAGWFRFCANPTDSGGASTTLPRVDGTVGTSGADMLLVTTAITSTYVYYINSSALTLPYQYGA